MRDTLIKRIFELSDRVEGFEYLLHRSHTMSNVELLDLYVEMRIEEFQEIKGVDYGPIDTE